MEQLTLAPMRDQRRDPAALYLADAVADDDGLCMDMRESARPRSTHQLLSRIAHRPRAL